MSEAEEEFNQQVEVDEEDMKEIPDNLFEDEEEVDEEIEEDED